MTNERGGVRPGEGLHPTLTFLREWLRAPRSIAALSPSGRQLARLMVAQVPRGAQRVIELGGGTGAITRALLDRGVPREGLLVLELNETLHQHLHSRFAGVHVAHADARHLRDVLRRTGFLDAGPADAVISSLGLLAMPRRMQREILDGAFAALRADGRFVQFTYGPSSPVPRTLLVELGLGVRRDGVAWWNVPPASVYVYQRLRTRMPQTAPGAGGFSDV